MTRNLRKCPFIFLILSVSVNANATVLYVRYSSDQIIIATDSKRTAETGQTVCVCKIAQIGDTFIASAGLAEFGEFDPKEFARQAISSSRTLIETRARFEELITDTLIDVLKRVRNKHPRLGGFPYLLTWEAVEGQPALCHSLGKVSRCRFLYLTSTYETANFQK